MNESNPKLDALFALARQQRPDTSKAEYAFETRLMARLRGRRQPDAVSLWAMVTWRMVPFFAVCVVGLALWNSEVVSDANETSSLSFLQHPETVDLLDGLN